MSDHEPSNLNEAQCKRVLIRHARDRAHFAQFETIRVSQATLDDLNAYVHSWIRRHVASLPSKGRTL